jgi:hypothetical protein
VGANPYVAELGCGREGALFTIGGVPAGKHRLDLWHPPFKPVQASIEFEIKTSENTAILIPFEPPAPLAKPKAPK